MDFRVETALYMAIKSLLRGLGALPLGSGRGVGACLGSVLFRLDPKHRGIVADNLASALGYGRQGAKIRRLSEDVFRNLGMVLFEIAWSLRLKEGDFSSYFSVRGLSNMTRAYERGKGVLALGCHLGNWELFPYVLATLGFPTIIVVRPLDFKPMDRVFTFLRTRFGAHVIPKKGSMRIVLKSLREGKLVGLLMDQNVDWYDGVFVEFFGRLACTNKGMALMAMHAKVPVVPCFLVRTTQGFEVTFGAEVPLVETGDRTRDIESNTQRYNDVIEAFVRRYPEQWFWVHQRWKTRPYRVLSNGKQHRG